MVLNHYHNIKVINQVKFKSREYWYQALLLFLCTHWKSWWWPGDEASWRLWLSWGNCCQLAVIPCSYWILSLLTSFNCQKISCPTTDQSNCWQEQVKFTSREYLSAHWLWSPWDFIANQLTLTLYCTCPNNRQCHYCHTQLWEGLLH